MENNEKAELLTAKKISEKLGISEGKVKKLIKELELQPDEVKGRCSYFGTENIKKIEQAIS